MEKKKLEIEFQQRIEEMNKQSVELKEQLKKNYES